MRSRWNSWLREDFICCSVHALLFGVLWLGGYQTSGPPSTEVPRSSYITVKAAVEVKERTDLSLSHLTCSSRSEDRSEVHGEKVNSHLGEWEAWFWSQQPHPWRNWAGREHNPGLEHARVCVLSVLWPTPAVVPGFPAQLSSASLARHCHLFFEGNIVIWSFSIKMWVVAWDTSNDANIHTLLHSLWTGMCNLGAIYKHSLARHPHFCDLQLSTGIMKLQRLILNLETDEFPCLSSVEQVKIVKIIITTMLICYYGYTLFK